MRHDAHVERGKFATPRCLHGGEDAHMELTEPSTAECLRVLLEEQARKLQATAHHIDALRHTGANIVHPVRWVGTARNAHDDLAQGLLANLTIASHAAHHAAEESARAAATLASRVG